MEESTCGGACTSWMLEPQKKKKKKKKSKNSSFLPAFRDNFRSHIKGQAHQEILLGLLDP